MTGMIIEAESTSVKGGVHHRLNEARLAQMLNVFKHTDSLYPFVQYLLRLKSSPDRVHKFLE